MKIQFKNNKSGFTLTEVMIGMMILTVAIVAASNLLVGVVSSNRQNTNSLQAYYLAQEGIEAVRNIRDTNWLHNIDYMGDDSGLFSKLEYGKTYSLGINSGSWSGSGGVKENADNREELIAFRPWVLTAVPLAEPWLQTEFSVGISDTNTVSYFDSTGDDDDRFYRYIEIKNPCEIEEGVYEQELCDQRQIFLVRSVVGWSEGGSVREVELLELLSNWKGGSV